jgi:hypothetical protein
VSQEPVVGGDWHIRVGLKEYFAPDISTVQQWCREGRVTADALIYHSSTGQWVRADKLPETRGIITQNKAGLVQRILDMTALWPILLTKQDAKSAAMQGTAACVALVAVMLSNLFFAKPTPAIDEWALVAIGLITFFGFGIWRMWRMAAVLPLIYFIYIKVYFFVNFTNQVEGSSVIFAFILLMMFVNGVRGTFAYRTLVNREKQRVATAISAA